METLKTLLAALLLAGSAPAIAQHIFVQTKAGVSVFDTDMKKVGFYAPYGSDIIGLTGSSFITFDLENGILYSYELSNGVIGKKTSSIIPGDYMGKDCGNDNQWPVFLNSTVYVMYDNVGEDGQTTYCSVIQTFAVDKGILTFKGQTQVNNAQLAGLGSEFTGSSKFAYAVESGDASATEDGIQGFAIEGSGSLAPINANVLKNNLGTPNYPPAFLAPDPQDQNHLAMGIGCCNIGLQLASYTIGSSGDLTSTNTQADMPATDDNWNYDLEIEINPAGNVLAVTIGTGIQFFHFNGADPITTFTGVIGESGEIVSMAWSGNTLYAVNNASGKLHVYDVSTTKVVEAAGSPYSLGALTVHVH
ncbi:MAG: hypothetical protein ABSF53_24880 [Terracidiphilus sp.]|jgi:hypothetical protein